MLSPKIIRTLIKDNITNRAPAPETFNLIQPPKKKRPNTIVSHYPKGKIYVLFKKFGEENQEEFTATEKVILRTAVEIVIKKSTQSVQISNSRDQYYTIDHTKRIKTWFGSDTHETVMLVNSGLNTIQDILTSSSKMIVFIDVRDTQKVANFYCTHKNVKPENLYSQSSGTPSFTGIGLMIYVAKDMLHFAATNTHKVEVIFRTLINNLLNLSNKPNLHGNFIHGSDMCKQLALESPARTLYTADSWINFIISCAAVDDEIIDAEAVANGYVLVDSAMK